MSSSEELQTCIAQVHSRTQALFCPYKSQVKSFLMSLFDLGLVLQKNQIDPMSLYVEEIIPAIGTHVHVINLGILDIASGLVATSRLLSPASLTSKLKIRSGMELLAQLTNHMVPGFSEFNKFDLHLVRACHMVTIESIPEGIPEKHWWWTLAADKNKTECIEDDFGDY